MPEIVILRASLPGLELVARFLEAMSRGADVDLIVEGRRTALLPRIARRLADPSRRDAPAYALGLSLFPKVIALLVQARQMGRTSTVRKVQGAREVVVEIRHEKPTVAA